MSKQNQSCASCYVPTNYKFSKHNNSFDFGPSSYPDQFSDIMQDHRQYSGGLFNVGMKRVFGNDDHTDEPVGQVFFSEQNIKRLQKMIKNEIYHKTNKKFILEEDQSDDDLLIAMRAVYQLHGAFINNKIVHQVKDLNKKLVDYVVPDMITQIKQYYGYLKDVNEPLKPIDRPMNVSNAGRKTLPSISTIW